LQDAGFAVLRTPLLPMSAMFDWSDELAVPAALTADDGDAIERCMAADRQRLTKQLRSVLARDIVRQAIYVASPGLAATLQAWMANPADKRGRRAVPALVSYLLRMAYRPTPFGLFAGCSTIEKSASTHLELEGADRYRSHSRLDVVYLAGLCQQFQNAGDLRDALSFRTNPGLYQVAGQWRLAEALASVDGSVRRAFHLVSIEASDALQATLARAVAGATIEVLVAGLMADYPDVSREDASAYLDKLIDSQLLISSLEPGVTGEDALRAIIATLEAANADARLVRPLQVAASALADIDAAGPAAAAGSYRRIDTILADLPVESASSHMLHVDLYKPASGAGIGPAVIAAVRDGVNLLHSICPPAQRADLHAFVAEFQARYQDREVPLMQVLDEESGIGFGKPAAEQVEDSPLIAGLNIARPSESAMSWSPRNAIVLRLLGEALRSQNPIIDLGQADIESLAVDDPRPLPTSLSANVTLVAASAEAIDQGDFKLLWHGAFGPSGAMYLGRFCQGDKTLRRRVQQHLDAEASHRPDAIFAEIVHLPQDRIGNVICRPSLRDYEIPYHGGSGVELDRQIPVADLMVRIDGGRIVLRSVRMDREVIPRLTTAHNAPQAELGVYRFLCALQTQGVCHWLAWDWGILESAAFLPRVQAGKLLLSRARWRLGAPDLKRIAGAKGVALMRRVRQLRERIGLPRWVQVIQVDRLLPLDLDNVLCVELFSSLARGKPALDLTEVYPMPDEACVRGPEGGFNHELVVPLQQAVTREAAATPGPPVKHRPLALYTPGSEWLYVKIYAGATQGERILLELLPGFVATERQKGSFDRWFYLRYADPHPQLRLRFHGREAQLTELWGRLQEALGPYVDNGSVWQIQLDTYDPEIERYGGQRGIALSEAIFAADSDACLDLLGLLEPGVERWQLTLLSVHRLFEDLHIALPARLRQLGAMRAQLVSEFEFGDSANKSLSRKHRQLRTEAEAVLSPESATNEGVENARSILDLRAQHIVPLGLELHKAQAAGHLDAAVEELALSYVHMTANRLLRSAARAQELVLYELLIGYYRGKLARQN
jgi:thiopeptide-type bacteriocin biosynthesis protein